jgi:type II secretory pathway pseudopilin PulG
MRKQRGTTMIEVVAVVGIMLVLAAILAPRMTRIIGDLRLRSSVDTVGYLLQQDRMRAVRDNKYYTVIPKGGLSSISACVDLNWSGNCDAGDPEVELPQSVSFASGAGVPSTLAINCGPSPSSPGPCPAGVTGLNYSAQAPTILPTFDARGLPCINKAGANTEPNWGNNDVCLSRVANTQVGFLYTFQYTGVLGGASYAALAVSPAGRITTWMYGGTDANGNAIWVR